MQTLLDYAVLIVCGGLAVFLILHGLAWARTFERAEWLIFAVGTGAFLLAAVSAAGHLLV